MKRKKVLIIFGGLLAAGTAIYFIFRKDTSKIGNVVRKVEQKVTGKVTFPTESYEDDVVVSGIPTQTSGTSPCAQYVQESFPLKRCARGSKVEAMQTILNKLYADKIPAQLTVDGYFGPQTEEALYAATGKRQLSQSDYLSLANAATAQQNIDGGDEDDSFFSDIYSLWFD